MTYTQKYCLVHFINPIAVGEKFSMTNWPSHITLADVFAINRAKSKLDQQLNDLLSTIPAPTTTAISPATLGKTEVILLEKTTTLQALHLELVTLLENNAAVFNAPEYTRSGFLPHCTIQNSQKIDQEQKVTINTVALVDMFPEGDWRMRRVLSTFQLPQS